MTHRDSIASQQERAGSASSVNGGAGAQVGTSENERSMVVGTGVSKTISAQEKKRKAMMFLKRLSEHGQEVLLDPRDEETLLSDDEKNDIERETRERLRAKKKPRPRDILASSAAFRSYCSVQEESASYS